MLRLLKRMLTRPSNGALATLGVLPAPPRASRRRTPAPMFTLPLATSLACLRDAAGCQYALEALEPPSKDGEVSGGGRFQVAAQWAGHDLAPPRRRRR